jgi:hypothetical protein
MGHPKFSPEDFFGSARSGSSSDLSGPAGVAYRPFDLTDGL